MPKIIRMEVHSENSIPPKITQPVKGPDKPPTQKTRPQINQLQRPETPSPISGKKRTQPDTMTMPTAQRYKKTQQSNQEENTLPPITFKTEDKYNGLEEDNYPMEEDESSLEYISQCDTTPEVPFEESTYPHLLNFRKLLGELTGLAASLKNQGHLEDILKDETVARNLEDLAEILPATPINRQLLPLLSRISELCNKVNSLINTLENQGNPNPNTIYGSIHAPPNSQAPTGPITPHNTPNNSTTPGQIKPGKKPPTPTTPTQVPTAPTNPRLAHHLTRIVAQFPPNGILDSDRWDPSAIVTRINNALASMRESKHLRIVAASYNRQGNLILSTRADQTAAELLISSNQYSHD